MVERIDSPAGTLGFRLAGELEADDYKDTIMPPVDEVLEAGGDLRMVFVIIDGFEMRDPKAIWEDVRADFEISVHHRENVKRSALVTDIDWIRRGVRMFGWVAPGELKVFALAELDEAKAWAAG